MSTEYGTETIVKIKTPSLYKVILLNDNYTPMLFVVQLLVELFNKSIEDAERITMNVHNRGKGIAGVYPKEIAEIKTVDANNYARNNGHPLQVVMEK